MKGLETARKYFYGFGLPMLEESFPDLMPYVAAGFTGPGSEHYGFDDSVSRDHDYEPGFCLFLPDETVVDRKRMFALERAYAKLPKEMDGLCRQTVIPVGGPRNGVFRTADFYLRALGTPDGRLSKEAWLKIPDYVLAEALNGEIYVDAYGEVTRIREGLKRMPEDCRKKRLAGHLIIMAQTGQYNFGRCLKHGEAEAAQLACQDFVQHTMKMFFLLSDSYMPFYKWSFRALRQLDDGAALADRLAWVMMHTENDGAVSRKREETIEEIAGLMTDKLRKSGLWSGQTDDLEKIAYEVNDSISEAEIRNRTVFYCV